MSEGLPAAVSAVSWGPCAGPPPARLPLLQAAPLAGRGLWSFPIAAAQGPLACRTRLVGCVLAPRAPLGGSRTSPSFGLCHGSPGDRSLWARAPPPGEGPGGTAVAPRCGRSFRTAPLPRGSPWGVAPRGVGLPACPRGLEGQGLGGCVRTLRLTRGTWEFWFSPRRCAVPDFFGGRRVSQHPVRCARRAVPAPPSGAPPLWCPAPPLVPRPSGAPPPPAPRPLRRPVPTEPGARSPAEWLGGSVSRRVRGLCGASVGGGRLGGAWGLPPPL